MDHRFLVFPFLLDMVVVLFKFVNPCISGVNLLPCVTYAAPVHPSVRCSDQVSSTQGLGRDYAVAAPVVERGFTGHPGAETGFVYFNSPAPNSSELSYHHSVIR